MEIKKKNSLKNSKKGLIFALDAAIAVTVVVLMVINSVYYFTLASKSSLSHLQAVKLAEDVVTMLDYDGSLAAVVINDTNSSFGPGPYNINPTLLNISKYLPSNYDMWVSISDLKETITNLSSPTTSSCPSPNTFNCPLCENKAISYYTRYLERNMTTMLQVNVSSRVNLLNNPSGNTPLIIRVNFPYSGQQRILPVSSKINGTALVGPFNFGKGVNDVTLRIDTGCVYWFRILGSAAYAGSTNDSMLNLGAGFTGEINTTNDRFVGAGERLFAVKKPWPLHQFENPVEGVHLLRYRIWLKGGT